MRWGVQPPNPPVNSNPDDLTHASVRSIKMAAPFVVASSQPFDVRRKIQSKLVTSRKQDLPVEAPNTLGRLFTKNRKIEKLRCPYVCVEIFLTCYLQSFRKRKECASICARILLVAHSTKYIF